MASTAAARRFSVVEGVDIHAKNIISAYPFQEETDSGEALNKILVETQGKKKAMPKSRDFWVLSPLVLSTLPRLNRNLRDPMGTSSTGASFIKELSSQGSTSNPWPELTEMRKSPNFLNHDCNRFW